MKRASFPSRYRTEALLLIGVVVIGLAVGVVSAGDDENVDLTQDHIVVESGETVVIEDRNTTTPTNFTVNEGGTLIIRNSTLFRTGEHHNDNEDYILGELRIENSTIYGEDGIPIEIPAGDNAKVIISNSNLQNFTSKYSGVSFFQFSGDHFRISNSTVGTVGASIDPAVDTALTLKDTKIHRMTLSIRGFTDTVELRNFHKDITNMELRKGGTVYNLTNVTMMKLPDVSSAGSGNTTQLQDFRLVNSTARITVHPTSNFTAVNSTTANPDIKFTNWDIYDTHEFSGIRKYGNFTDKYLVNKSYLKMRWVDSTIPEWYEVENFEMRHGAFGIDAPGGGKNDENTPDIILKNSTLYAMSIGQNLTARNMTADRLSIYNNYGGIFQFDDVHFNFPGNTLSITQGANVTIKGNVSFEGGIDDTPGLVYLNISRRYPVDLSNIAQDEAEGDPIRVIVQNPNGTEVANTSYPANTEFVFPKVRYNLTNYKKSFTLTIQQGNRSTSRPLTLTTDTPIHVDLSTQQLTVNDLVAPETVRAGEEFNVSVTVENTGDSEVTENLTLKIDGAVKKTSEVSVAGGTTKTLAFENVSIATTGNYTLNVSSAEKNVTRNLTVKEPAPVIVGDSPARDLDGDGLYEDVNGDGEVNIVDVNAFFQHYRDQVVKDNADLFDFNGDGDLNIVDVNALFASL